MTIQLRLIVQEPRAFFFNGCPPLEFVESKICVVCENLFLKMILIHNAEMSKMAANYEVSISNKALTL